MKWRMSGIGLDDVIITADSFDEALAKARKINRNYSGGTKDMTNYERIKGMSVEEMATLLSSVAHNCEKYCAFTLDGKCNVHDYDNTACIEGLELWLASEVEE